MLSRQERLELEAKEKLYQDLAEECTCTPISDRPCAGLLNGGLCDNLHLGKVDNEDVYKDREDWDVEDL